MTLRRVLLATRNPHKLREISALLSGWPVELTSLEELGIASLPGEEEVEIFGTFEQNALAKAQFYRRHAGMEVIADDSGLCVDALGGGPGVRSRRFAADHGIDGTDQDAANNRCLIRQLRGVDDDNRGAHYRCALAYVGPARTLIVSGRVDGAITREERGPEGFGYDPLFLLPSCDQTFGELPAEVKAAISHRAEAVRSFRRWLEPVATEEGIR